MKTNKTSEIGVCRSGPLILLFLGLAVSGIGCKAIQTVQFKPGSEQINKQPVRVALVLEGEFCKFEHHRDPEGYVYPLGAYLCPCARHVAHEAFAKVTEFDSLEAAMKCPDVDALLIPKLVKVEIRARGVAWEKRHTLVVLEWSMKTLKDQKTVWLATAEGKAEGKVGTMLTMDKKDRVAMQQAMDDLYRKSVETFNQSEELKTFARQLARQ